MLRDTYGQCLILGARIETSISGSNLVVGLVLVKQLYFYIFEHRD